MKINLKSIKSRFTAHPIKLWIYTVLSVFIVLVGFSVTNSSIGQLNYSESKEQTGLLLGAPNPIRSDEYLRWTPQFIAQTNFGDSVSLLDYQNSSDYLRIDNSLASRLVDLLKVDFQIKSLIEKVLPIEMAFALNWWTYVFLALLFLPLFINLFGAPLSLAIPATLLVFFSPGNQWWSNGQIVIFGLAAPGFYFLLKAFQDQKSLSKKSILQFVFAVVLLAQLPFQYQPWSIPITIFLGTLTFTQIYFSSSNKPKFAKQFIIFIFITLALILTRIFVERNGFQILADTVYPGQRRIEIESSEYPLLSTVLSLRMQDFGPTIKFGNPPEAAIAFLEIAALLSLLLPIFAAFRNKGTQAKVLISAAGTLGIYLLWIFGFWPSFLLTGNLLTFVSQDRLAQVTGQLALVALPIFLTFIAQKPIRKSKFARIYSLAAVALIAALMFGDVRDQDSVFRIQVYQLDSIYRDIALFIFAVAMLLYVRRTMAPVLWIGVLALGILAQFINPIQQGTSDLLDSQLAKKIQDIELDQSGTWASNEKWLDTILIANVDGLLSGQQQNGPNISAWKLLDPNQVQNNAWNRGSSFVLFNWVESPNVMIENPANDVIQISTNPCNPALDEFKLQWILSTTELNYSCLTKYEQLKNASQTSYFIYQRKFS